MYQTFINIVKVIIILEVIIITIHIIIKVDSFIIIDFIIIIIIVSVIVIDAVVSIILGGCWSSYQAVVQCLLCGENSLERLRNHLLTLIEKIF